jgi:hypothetical protein
MARVGWYRLPSSGRAFHGTIPSGAEEIDGPDDDPASRVQRIAHDFLTVLARMERLDEAERSEVGVILDQLVETGESSGPVGADVAGLDLSADALEVGDGPGVDGGPAGDDQVDGVVRGQGQKRTRQRKPAQGDG